MMTAEQLKNSILQLAMQGKLVEQRPEEGTGEELFGKIQAERKKLVREGKVKKVPQAEVVRDEVPFDIPDSWHWVRISEISSIINGDRGKNYPSKSTLSHEGIPFISALNLDGRTVVEDDSLLCVSQEQYDRLGSGKLEKGDIVVCIRGSLGKHGRYPFEKGAIASSLVICRQYIKSEVMALFLMVFLDAPLFFDQIKQYNNGTAQPNLAAKSLEQFLIPLPPLAEQKRIVAKIEELMPFVEQYANASTKLNTLNATFPEMMKKSILQEAVQGKLVPQDPNDEPASLLLKKIAEEKKRLIKEGKIKKDKKEKYIYRRENSWWEIRDSIEVCLDQELPFDIPDTWSWVHLSNICETIFDIDHKMPKAVDKDHGVLFLSAKDLIDDGTINYEHNVKYISHDDAERLSKKGKPRRGDILYSRIGACLGKARIIDRDVELIASYSCCTIRLIDQRLTNYLQMIMDGGFVLSQARDKTQSIGVPDLGMQMIKDFFIPIPPLEEQKRIYEKYESIYKQVDSLWK